MVSNADDMSICVTRPVSAAILLLSALMVLWPIWKARRRCS
jgi:TctA family transporter